RQPIRPHGIRRQGGADQPTAIRSRLLLWRTADDLPSLDTLALEHLGGEDVTPRVDGDVVHAEELPGHAAETAIGPNHFAVGPADHTHLVVAAVDIDQEALLLVRPQIDIPDRTAQCLRQVDPFAHEAAVLAEDLQPIIGAIANIDQPVIGDLHAMDRVVEGLRDRRVRGIGMTAGIGWGRIDFVGRAFAIGAPVALVGPSRGIEHDDAVIAVAVRDVQLVGGRVDPEIGRLPELGRVIVALARTGLADLHHELAIAGELEKETIVLVVAAEPDKVLVDANAVLLLRPFVASPVPAPGLHDIAVRIELDDRGRRDAALGAGRLLPGRRLEP